ncbi:hypothetical protein CS390_09355 [Pseudomonas sp. HLS-6]|uniref:DUF1654 domain-containing protein n=1 Tax=Pseudomonas sp. HLS-6 TaxID=2049589 RepID=UPI000C187B69|nr:DUF1654 domain-containing protein [Pseudomonas sp. HLS-6]ATR82753.1 hypothetical protein CS390_09355 [Pseudomonas sp. HLS-6]
MSKKKKDTTQQERQELTGVERLGLRVSAMINSPMAQLGRRVLIHRLDTDSDEAWDAVMELLAETDGIEMTFNDDGSVILQWEKQSEEDQVIEQYDAEVADEAAPF